MLTKEVQRCQTAAAELKINILNELIISEFFLHLYYYKESVNIELKKIVWKILKIFL